jgi:hypothetical protein
MNWFPTRLLVGMISKDAEFFFMGGIVFRDLKEKKGIGEWVL